MIKHPPSPFLHTLTAAIAASVFSFCLSAHGMLITGYSAAQNDRFASGFPTAPVPNLSLSFVGAGLDWSGVGWSIRTHAASSYKGLALLSPKHFLTAQHYEYPDNNEATTGIRILDNTGQIQVSEGIQEIRNLEQGIRLTNYEKTAYDIAVGVLVDQFKNPSAIFRMGVLDLHGASTGTNLGEYAGLAAFLYGRSNSPNGSPRVAAENIERAERFNGTIDSRQHVILTPQTLVRLEAGDSSAPLLHAWQNPNESFEPSLLATNSVAWNGFNYSSMIATAAAINAANQAMNPDGFALRVVGNPSNTWMGSSSTDINRNSAWGAGGNQNSTGATSDKFVLFSAASAANQSVNVNTNYNLRGLYFRSTAAANDHFTFGGSPILTIGRGGITNYDNDRQNFNAPLALGSAQYWDAGPGGVRVTNLNTNGRLLEIRSAGPSEFAGVVSGTGGLALESGQLLLSGNSTYTGRTWAHSGTLRVTGSIASSQALVLGDFAAVTGSGSLPATQGSGSVSPGNPGADTAVLTAPSIHPAGGMDFVFRFSQFAPDFSQSSNAANDVLRLTSPTPFGAAFQAQNRVEFFLDRPELLAGETYRGGFFSHQPDDFFPVIENAEVRIYVPDVNGPVSHEGKNYIIYAGERPLVISTEAQTASIGGSTVNGRILQIEVQPNPAAFEGWAASAFPEEVPEELRTPNADANADGAENLLAYAFGVNPMQPAAQALPFAVVEEVPAGGGEDPETLTKELAFRFHRNPTAQDLLFQVEVSDDLVVWSNWGGVPAVVDSDPRGDGSAELVEVRVPMQQGLERKFARLRVQMAAWQN